MENNFLKPCSQNKGAKALFYIFEISALCVGVLMFITSIIIVAQGWGFASFIQSLCETVLFTLVLFGLGKMIDLLSCKHEHHCQKDKKDKEDAE